MVADNSRLNIPRNKQDKLSEPLEIEYEMDNSELQDSIITTNAMIKSCEPAADRYRTLNSHLERLIDIQAARAAVVKIN